MELVSSRKNVAPENVLGGKMKFRNNDCLDCPLDSYSPEESYNNACTAQTPCSAGKRALDRTNKVSAYTCIDCDENTYSESNGFECATQPVCERVQE